MVALFRNNGREVFGVEYLAGVQGFARPDLSETKPDKRDSILVTLRETAPA
jgi:hypothetical protein